MSAGLWVAMVCFAVAGFFEMIYLTTNQTLLQLSIPDALRGPVTGIVSLNCRADAGGRVDCRASARTCSGRADDGAPEWDRRRDRGDRLLCLAYRSASTV